MFNGDKAKYDFADFHIGWFSDAARMIHGERVYRHTEAMKECGKTLIHADIAAYLLKEGIKKHIRFTHSVDDVRKEFNDAMYNNLLNPLVVLIWGDLIGETRKKREDKRRFTGSLIQLTNGGISRTSTSLQIATGTTDLRSGHRVDLQLLDDAANIAVSESEVIARKYQKRMDELISGTSKAKASVLSFCNPQTRNRFTDDLRNDSRFIQERIYLYKPDGSLNWAYTPRRFGKYVETEQEAKEFREKYPDREPVVSVEYEKTLKDYEITMLGKGVDPSLLFFKTQQQPAPYKSKIISGVELRIFARPKEGHIYGIATDHSQGQGGHNQALILRDYTLDEVVATLREKHLKTKVFAGIAARLHRGYNQAMFGPENDGGQGTVFIDYLRDDHEISKELFYRNTVTDNVGADKRERKLGYVPGLRANRAMYERLQQNINSVKLNCPVLLDEIQNFTFFDYEHSTENADGHNDLIRALAISEQMRTEAMSKVNIMSVLN